MTPFQKKVLHLAGKIPVGKVSTYKILAVQSGRKNASRAVGQALHNNPFPIYKKDAKGKYTPCHRVICSDGSLGGFNGGVTRKKKLLQKEGIAFQGNRIADAKKFLFHFSSKKS